MTETSERIALVTGASRGIGFFTALELAKAGLHVIAVAKTVGGLEELDDQIKNAGGTATLAPLDLQDYGGIDRLGEAVNERWGKLDILVGNAAVLGGLSPLGHVEVSTYNKVMGTNVTANWRLIRSFDPLLRQSENANAVFVSDTVAGENKPFWGIYAQSKAALENLVKTYEAECNSGNISVGIFKPQPTRTALRAGAMPGEDVNKLEDPAVTGKKLAEFCLAV